MYFSRNQEKYDSSSKINSKAYEDVLNDITDYMKHFKSLNSKRELTGYA